MRWDEEACVFTCAWTTGEIMNRKVSLRLLTTAACASVMTMVGNAAPAPSTHHVWSFVANGQAQLVGHLPASRTMRLTIALPLRNEPALQSFLQDLYNPSSPSFHQFLTVEQFTAAYGPTEADYNALITWAQTHGLTVLKTSPNNVNLQVSGTVDKVEAAFRVNLGVYKDPEVAGRTFFATNTEPAPDLSIPLWHVTGLDDYAVPQPAVVKRPAGVQPNATTGSCPSESFCGSDMRPAYYGTGSLTGTGQYLGLLEYYGTDLADLNTYYTNAKQTNTVPIDLLSVDGTSVNCLESQGCDDTEQTIDMTQALGMAPGLAKLTMFIGDSDPLDDSGILNAMATTTPLNASLSSSWTWRPADPTTDDPYFMEFAAQGQNYFNAAGDSRKWTKSQDVFPAEDDYVTCVGGTDLTTASAGGPWASETAWSSSGGGISPDDIGIPSWQVAAAAGCASCSQVYRNGPDVSGNANYTYYVCADQEACTANEYGGTSFATPMWAAYIALANEQAVTNTGKTIGFINPTLYTTGLGSSYDANFHDITSGSNGFSATVGYDLVTGWGSPNGPTLITTLGGSSANFTIATKPTTVSIAEGSTGGVEVITTVSGGFDSAIALSASGEPSGVHVGFSPTSIPAPGSGTAKMGIKVGKATPGVYTITVTGTGDSITHSATVTLTVTK
jgi:subtilase family serine protease